MVCVNKEYLLPDVIWEKIKFLLPKITNKKKPGRPRMDDRAALIAIFYLLCTGMQWKALPRCLGASSTVHDRFKFWSEQGFFYKLWQYGLLEYDAIKGIDWQWQSMDGCHVMAPLAGENTGPSFKHWGKSGTNRSLLTDGSGIPIALHIAAANRLDYQLTEQTLNAFVLPRPNPDTSEQHICLDKGYDYPEIDTLLDAYQYVTHIRRKGIDYSLLVPKYRARRWVVERSHSWLNNYRRLLIRWETKSSHYSSLLYFACALICFRRAES